MRGHTAQAALRARLGKGFLPTPLHPQDQGASPRGPRPGTSSWTRHRASALDPTKGASVLP